MNTLNNIIELAEYHAEQAKINLEHAMNEVVDGAVIGNENKARRLALLKMDCDRAQELKTNLMLLRIKMNKGEL